MPTPYLDRLSRQAPEDRAAYSITLPLPTQIQWCASWSLTVSCYASSAALAAPCAVTLFQRPPSTSPFQYSNATASRVKTEPVHVTIAYQAHVKTPRPSASTRITSFTHHIHAVGVISPLALKPILQSPQNLSCRTPTTTRRSRTTGSSNLSYLGPGSTPSPPTRVSKNSPSSLHSIIMKSLSFGTQMRRSIYHRRSLSHCLLRCISL